MKQFMVPVYDAASHKLSPGPPEQMLRRSLGAMARACHHEEEIIEATICGGT